MDSQCRESPSGDGAAILFCGQLGESWIYWAEEHPFCSIPPAKPVPSQSCSFILLNYCDSVLLTEILTWSDSVVTQWTKVNEIQQAEDIVFWYSLPESKCFLPTKKAGSQNAKELQVWEKNFPPFWFNTLPAAKLWSVGQVLDRHHSRSLGVNIMAIQKPCIS